MHAGFFYANFVLRFQLWAYKTKGGGFITLTKTQYWEQRFLDQMKGRRRFPLNRVNRTVIIEPADA